jgi:hypothetical protein
MPKINREDYEILKSLDKKWKWIAKIRGMGLVAFDISPKKYGDSKDWAYARSSQRKELDRNLLQFVEYDDDYPYSIADLIEEYEDSKEYKDSLVIEYFMDKAKKARKQK